MIAPYSTLGPWDILPERVTLHNEAFTDAFAAFRLREEAAGRKVTYETFSDEAGINERVFRKARTGHGKLPRHQVLKIAERLGCTPSSIVKRSIVEDPDRVAKLKAEDERDRKDMAAWPVPLREVVSWTEFVEHLKMVESARPTWGDDVLSLAAAPAIDAFDAALRYSSQVAKDNPAMAAAALKDAAADLQALDLHVLAGRYVARRDGDHHSYMELVYVLEVWIRREAEDLAHMVDRSSEPMCTTMAENEEDDTDVIDGWLAWEGKRRLSLWRGDDTE